MFPTTISTWPGAFRERTREQAGTILFLVIKFAFFCLAELWHRHSRDLPHPGLGEHPGSSQQPFPSPQKGMVGYRWLGGAGGTCRQSGDPALSIINSSITHTTCLPIISCFVGTPKRSWKERFERDTRGSGLP